MAGCLFLFATLERNQFGILMGHRAQATMRENNVSESDRPIRVWDQSRAVIENNTISRNNMTGLAVKDQA